MNFEDQKGRVKATEDDDSDQSDREDVRKSSFRRKKSTSIPRKRVLGSGNARTLGPSFPADEAGNLDILRLFDRGDRSWQGQVVQEAKDDFRKIVLDPEVDYQVDLATLDITPVLKQRRLSGQEISRASGSKSGSGSSSEDPEVKEDEVFQKPKLRCRKFIFKPFKRLEDGSLVHDEDKNPVDVTIPEQLAASYGLYIWPCSPVLAWYIWLHQGDISGKTILELGAGTCLPGLLCAKIGAAKVYLTDDYWQPNTLKNCEEAVKVNNFQDDRVKVLGLSWGDYSADLLSLKDLDYVIGSDLFFDPKVFEPLLSTLSILFEQNSDLKVLITVQERSSDWSIEQYLQKWKLTCDYVYPREFLRGTGIDESDLIGGHNIFVLRMFKTN